MQSNRNCYKKHFSRIYVEKDAFDYPIAKEIISGFPNATIVEIRHYKDLFNRPGQDASMQRHSRSLILAVERAPFLYPGARVCQDFGNDAFYYTSTVKNCLFSCDYCYMQGMYRTAYPVIFVNFDDYLSEIDRMSKMKELYICLSYDTDLIAMDGLTGYLGRWTDALSLRPKVTAEVRTKGAPKSLRPLPNVIYAYTISPERVATLYEKGTPSVPDRLRSAAGALGAGARVRLCFDPMIYIRDWKKAYDDMLDLVSAHLPFEKLEDVSVGGFRMPKEYIRHLKKLYPDSDVVQYPFENSDGICHYPKALEEEMIGYLSDALAERMPKEKIFVIKQEEGEEVWNKGNAQS